MVIFIRALSIFFLLPLFVFSAEFTASVNHNPVYLGENFTLNLSLKDATAKAHPSVDDLLASFSITSQHQFFNTSVVNSKVTSTVTWKLSLFPHREGTVILPPISVKTSEGVLVTEPITLEIKKKSPSQNQNDENDILLKGEVSNAKPYKNEPFTYTVKLISKNELANIQTKKLQIDDAIVEAHGEAKVYRKIVDGINFNVIEFEYLITPLKAESLKIPPTFVQGLTSAKRKASSRSHFDDDFDLLSMMRGFDTLKPFALSTEELNIDVQAPVSNVTPWLPAKSVALEEIWDDAQTLQVGEPLTRGFKILATGIKSSQLPSLESVQEKNSNLKIYADKPELNDREKNRILESERKELYTLIPQKPGILELPEISLAWWDVVKNEKMVAKIPARTLNILPAVETTQTSMINPQEQTESPILEIVTTNNDPLFFAVIAALSTLLAAAFLAIIILFRKLKNSKNPITKKALTQALNPPKMTLSYEKYKRPLKKDKQEKLPDLNPT